LIERNSNMKGSEYSLLSKLNPGLFWDVDLSKLKADTSSRLIIERVFSLGDIHEMQEVISYYGREKVLDVMSNLSYIDPKTFNFITKLFNKPAKEFKCYQRKQSKNLHWNL
jgi:hypothetical protein